MIKKYKIKIGKNEQEIIIIKKYIKKISLQVKPSMEIILNIPMNISYSYGLKLIENKYTWIEDKLKKYISLSNNEGIYYLGKLYPLKKEKNYISIQIEIENIISNNPNTIDLVLNQWYQEKITNILEKFIKKYSTLMDLYPKKIKIKPLKSAWGICYSSGTITFNLNLIKVPLNIIEYLVVHELGHLKHPNHSKEYWKYIGIYIKNPISYRRWLKNNGYKFI